MKKLLFLLSLLPQLIFSEIITGFNQLEVGNIWKYKTYSLLYGGSHFEEMKGFKTITIDSIVKRYDSSLIYYTQIDTVVFKTSDLTSDTIAFDTVIINSNRGTKVGNKVHIGPWFINKDTLLTDNLLSYDQGITDAEMWCRRKVNNLDKYFFIDAWDRAVPFGWVKQKKVFIQDNGLVYYWCDGGDHGMFYKDTLTLLSFNGVEVNTGLILDVLNENVTPIENKEILAGLNCKKKAQSHKIMFLNNRLHLPDIGMPKQVSIYNSRGQYLFSQHIKSSALELEGLAPSVYYYTITTANNSFKGIFLVAAK